MQSQFAPIRMSSFYPRFVIVLYPGPARPHTIFEALSDNKAVALNILSYKQWLHQDYIPEQPIICMTDNSSWYLIQDHAEKVKLKKELMFIIRQSRIAA